MLISGSFDIIPLTVGFAGQLCRFVWSSTGATSATISDIGIVPPNGETFVYIANPKTYSITFTDTVHTLVLSRNVSVLNDPEVFFRQTIDNVTTVSVVRTIQEHSFNQTRPPSSGTPSYIISSRAIVPLSINVLSDEDFVMLT